MGGRQAEFSPMRARRSVPGGFVFAAAMLAGPALAADYPVLRGTHAPSLPPPPVIENAPVADWNGLYFGGLAGYSIESFQNNRGPNALIANFSRSTVAEAELQASSLVSVPDFSSRGVAFGGFLGYNMQFDDALIGFEADYTRIGRGGSATDTIGRSRGTSDGYITSVNLTGRTEARLNDLFSLRLRAGYVMGSVMLYATGGVAFGLGNQASSAVAQISGVDADPLSAPVLPPYSANSGTLTSSRRNAIFTGYTGGLGAEALLGGLLLRGEYLYTRLVTPSSSAIDINQVRVGAGVKF
jgi:opacity protein-like surface antigen